jgi:hypothetical protein
MTKISYEGKIYLQKATARTLKNRRDGSMIKIENWVRYRENAVQPVNLPENKCGEERNREATEHLHRRSREGKAPIHGLFYFVPLFLESQDA